MAHHPKRPGGSTSWYTKPPVYEKTFHPFAFIRRQRSIELLTTSISSNPSTLSSASLLKIDALGSASVFNSLFSRDALRASFRPISWCFNPFRDERGVAYTQTRSGRD